MPLPINYFDPSLFLLQLFTDNGSPTGSPDMTINGTTTPTEFYVQPPENQIFHIDYLSLSVINASGGLVPTGYMDLAALPSGIRIYAKRDASIIADFTGVNNINITGDWEEFVGLIIVADKLNDPSQVIGNVSYSQDGGVWLQGNKQDKLVVLIQDNLSTLLFHEISVAGRKYPI